MSRAARTNKRSPTAKTVALDLRWLFIKGVIYPGALTIGLCFLALELRLDQWWKMLPLVPVGVLVYALPEAWLMRQLYKPVGQALASIDAGRAPEPELIAAAVVRALNLPYYSFLRITIIRGLLGALVSVGSLWLTNEWRGGDFQLWQMVMFPSLVLFFACPAYAMVEYLITSRHLVPVVEHLWQHCGHLQQEHQRALIIVRLKTKLLSLCAFITTLPLLFIASSLLYKVYALVTTLGVADPWTLLLPLFQWLAGALAVCIAGAFLVSLMTAQEVSTAASRLIAGMNEVERGNLAVDLKVLGTGGYDDLTRGFNLMTDGLRDEVKLLEISKDLAGELQLDVLIARILRAATEMLDADRGTLFVHNAERQELYSRIADGLKTREIRIPDHSGIAGAVFTEGKPVNLADAYADPRFNADIDRRTGYRTRSILCMPIVNKTGKRIGVTQILNKRGSEGFTSKDEYRLAALNAQISVTLENATLFDEVLAIKSYNENILASSTDGVITLSNSRAFVSANAAARRILGLEGRDAVTPDLQQQFITANPWVNRSVIKVQATGINDVIVDAELQRLDGSRASVNLTTAPLRNPQGESLGFMLSIEDLTEEKRVKSTMARYMSKEVVEQLLEAGEAALGGHLQKVTVLFSDVRGFTRLAERVGAKETVNLLNAYFEQMVEVVFQHRGLLDKYIGDAIMAVFGSPFTAADDADRAVATGLDMLQALRRFNESRHVAGLPPLSVGIGIATDEVIVGNIGCSRRMEYTVIGDGVNLSARLEAATKYYGLPLLLSEGTVNALTKPLALREIDRLRLPGKDQAVRVYEPLAHYSSTLQSSYSQRLADWTAALLAYRARDFAQADALFAGFLHALPDDAPAILYRSRRRHYLADPPAADWDGVWPLHSQ